MFRIVAFLSCLACFPVIAIGAETPALGAATGSVVIHPSGSEAQRGIGPVRLNDTQAQVEHALGTGTLLHTGTQEGFSPSEQFNEAVYRYRSGAILIEVIYGEGEHQPGVADVVESLITRSPLAVLFGHRLSAGLRFFEGLLKAHRWHVFRCDHEVFTTLLPGGPGTGIAWKSGRVHEVVIDRGGSWGQQCEH